MTRLAIEFIVESGTDVRLVDGLAERADVRVLARRIDGGVEVSRKPAHDVPVIVGPASRSAFAALVFRRLLAGRESRHRVIVQGYGPAALAANAASRLTGTPAFMLVCSPVELYYECRRDHPAPEKPFSALQLAALRRLARANARLGREYVVLSKHLGDVVRSHGSRHPVHVVPVYGVDTTVFRPPTESRETLRRRRSLPLDGDIIFFSSRIAPEKDGKTLLEALGRLRAAGREVWLLHRSGGYRDLISLAARMGLSERVLATDAVHPLLELPLDYQAVTLCVQASRQEGLGFSPLEALACGTPVVAAAVGGLLETVVAGKTGWTYPPGDATGLTEAIAAALDHPLEARRRTDAGRDMVIRRYERGLVFDRLMDILEAAAA